MELMKLQAVKRRLAKKRARIYSNRYVIRGYGKVKHRRVDTAKRALAAEEASNDSGFGGNSRFRHRKCLPQHDPARHQNGYKLSIPVSRVSRIWH